MGYLPLLARACQHLSLVLVHYTLLESRTNLVC